MLLNVLFEDHSSRWKFHISTIVFVFAYGIVNNVLLNRTAERVAVEAATLGLLFNAVLLAGFIVIKSNPGMLREAVRTLKYAGQFQEAIDTLKLQEEIFKERGDVISLQQTYESEAEILEMLASSEVPLSLIMYGAGNTSAILLESTRLKRALFLYQEQGSLCKKIGNQSGLLRSYEHQLSILITLNEFGDALAIAEKKEIVYKELGSELLLGYCYFQSGIIAQRLNISGKAKDKLQSALDIFDKLGMHDQAKVVKAELHRLFKTAAHK